MQPDAQQGDNAQEQPEMREVSFSEAVHLGAEYRLAGEFVSGLIALAEAKEVPLQDFLAEKAFLLSQRMVLAESEVEILRHQMAELERKLEACTCQTSEETKDFESRPVSLPADTSTDGTNNGAGGEL